MSFKYILLVNNTIKFITQRMYEGGAFFMYTLLIVLFFIVYLIFNTLLKKVVTEKQISLINSISLFALVFGFLGQIIGMIEVFDAIEFEGRISPDSLGSGVKASSLSPAFGMLVFLVGRFGTIVITALKK